MSSMCLLRFGTLPLPAQAVHPPPVFHGSYGQQYAMQPTMGNGKGFGFLPKVPSLLFELEVRSQKTPTA